MVSQWSASVAASFAVYCFVSGITPGPANLLSLATAISKGRSVALRQWRGLFTGYFTVSVISAILVYFLGTRLSEYVRWFTWIGAAYIIYLAVHLLQDAFRDAGGSESSSRRNGFLTGFLTQITNVKIIVFCMTVMTGYVLPYSASLLSFLLMGAILPFIGPVCNLVWLFTGASLQGIFRSHRKPINCIMALSLIGCAVTLLLN